MMLSGRCGANLKCECGTVGVRVIGMEPEVPGSLLLSIEMGIEGRFILAIWKKFFL